MGTPQRRATNAAQRTPRSVRSVRRMPQQQGRAEFVWWQYVCTTKLRPHHRVEPEKSQCAGLTRPPGPRYTTARVKLA